MVNNQTIDILAILGLFLTFIFGVIAVVQTYRANKLSRYVAKKQGALETPNIEISLFEQQRIERFIFAASLTKGRVLEMPLRFKINNTGVKSARDVELFIRIPKDLCYGGSEMAKMLFSSALSKATGKVVHQTDNLETIMITFETLHPKQYFQLNQKLSLRSETFFHSNVNVPLIDGSVNVSYAVGFAYLLDFVLMQADQKPKLKRFSIEFINTSEMTVETYFRNRNIELQAQESSVGFWKNSLRHLFSKSATYQDHKFELIQVDNKYIAADPALPIDRVSDKASLSICEGIRFKDRYIIPALNLGIDG